MYKYKIKNETREFEKYISIISPITNDEYAKVPSLSIKDVDEIYDYAKEQQKLWAELTISQRGAFLIAWADLLVEKKVYLANIMVNEIAKSYKDAETEIVRTSEYIKYTVEQMYRIIGQNTSSENYYGGNKGKIAITKYVPLGVVLAISPFNYPVNLAVTKIAPALIAGNSIVFKPATQGSVIGIEIIKLLEQTGIMPGVVNIVTGSGSEIGDYLSSHELVDFISFTGGSKTGENIASVSKMVPLVLELGGKDAAIILDDADLDFTIKDIVSGAFSYSGQRCTAIKRVLVSTKNKKLVEEMLIEEVKKLTVSNDMMANPNIGPLIDVKSANYVDGIIQEAIKDADLLIGNKRENNLIYPTIITNVKRDSELAIVEPFGPVLPIIEYDNINDAISINNESKYGLQASVYGNNINDLMYIAERLEVGTINFNGKTSRGPDNFPFIGFKNSGMGAQGIEHALKSMMKVQTIVINK